MRKVLCTIAAGPHRALLEVSGPSLERYAVRHGYELVALEHNLVPQRPASWAKVALVHELAHDHDLVFWVDSDAVIVDDSVDVAGEIGWRPLHLVVHDTRDGRIPNLGVFVARGNSPTRALLRRLWERRAFTHHRWWENAALLDLTGHLPGGHPVRGALAPWRLAVGTLDKRWNSIPADPAPAPRIAHFPGMTNEQRITAMRVACRA